MQLTHEHVGKWFEAEIDGVKVKGKVSLDHEGNFALLQNRFVNMFNPNDRQGFIFSFSYSCDKERIKNLRIIEKSLETLEVDDILVDMEGDERKVLMVSPDFNCVLLSEFSNFHDTSCWETISSLKSRGYKLKNSPSEPMHELTLEEVAKLAGVPVERLRIKE
jgi:hypothetical protein